MTTWPLLREQALLLWCAWTTACPRPRLISQRLTGNANAPAMRSATARLPQNKGEVRGASMAPGITNMIKLSMTSMMAIEIVSAANARPSAEPKASPARSSGSIVKA
jgi:hypothetical protein